MPFVPLNTHPLVILVRMHMGPVDTVVGEKAAYSADMASASATVHGYREPHEVRVGESSHGFRNSVFRDLEPRVRVDRCARLRSHARTRRATRTRPNPG